MYIRKVLLLALAIAVLLLPACSLGGDDEDGDNEPASTPTPEVLTGESVLDRAAERWNETDGLHFTLEAEGDAFLDSDRTIRLLSAEGDVARPASVEATARVDVSVTSVNVNLIVIEEQAYMTNIISGDWEEAPGDFSYNPARLFDEDEGLAPIMRDIQDPELVGSENVDGRDAHQVTGTVTGEQIDQITAGSIQGDQIDVTLWVAEDNFDVLRLRLHAPGGEDSGETSWDLTFSNHDQDVTIEAPI